jgi:type I restriction enzyme R subunit
MARGTPTLVSYAWIGINTQEDPIHWHETYSNIPLAVRLEFEHTQRRRFYVELNKCHGSCVLAEAHDIVSKALEFFHGKRVWTGDYVVMPNHVHVLMQMFPGVILEEWLYSIKRFTAYNIKKITLSCLSINPNKEVRQHFWREESYDRIVRNTLELVRMRQYIANNPKNLPPETFSIKQMAWLDEIEKTLELKS